MQTNPAIFSGVLSTVSSIWRNEGITAFWKGSIPTAAGMVAENSMAFGVNAALKRAFPDPTIYNAHERQQQEQQMPSLGRPFIMGALTGCCSAFVLLPSEIIKAKLQVVVGGNVTTQQIMKQMVQKQGYMSYMTGLDAQLARDASFYAVFFGGYELFCYLFRTHVPSMPEELNFFLSGGLAGPVPCPLMFPKRYDSILNHSSSDTKSYKQLIFFVSLYLIKMNLSLRMYKRVMKPR
jgi:Mitochondrial carrier protein